MMKQENIFRKLGTILNELNDQYEFLSQNPNQLNELELELFYANASFLSDHIQIIKKLNANPPVRNLTAGNEVMVATPPQENKLIQAELPVESQIGIPENTTVPIQENTVPPMMPNAEVQIEEPLPTDHKKGDEIFRPDNSPTSFELILNEQHDDAQQFEYEVKPRVMDLYDRPLSEEEQHIIAKKIDEAQIVGETDDDEIGPEPFLMVKEEPVVEQPVAPIDLTGQELPAPQVSNAHQPKEDPNFRPTLNDILAAKSGGGTINTGTVSVGTRDLKQLISLNDKMLYIKDLFNGYNLAYAEAIDVANKLPNFDAAAHFFTTNYAQKNNWAEKQATVDQFYQVLAERFG